MKVFKREGGTFRYGVEGGRPRRLEVGEEVRRAQSRGEWPGVSSTFWRGLRGGAVDDGGGKREVVVGVRFGRGREREGGSSRPAAVREGEGEGGGIGRVLRRGGPRGSWEVRWAEFMAGKEGGGMLS